jgi:hypothetical protein
MPSASGNARVRVTAEGLDGSRVGARRVLRVLSRAPTIRLARAPARAVVGRPLRIAFRLRHSVGAVAEVSVRGGIEFTRRYVLRRGSGVVEWTPRTAGQAILRIRADGHQGQSARALARVTVARARPVAAPPTVTLLATPHVATVGRTYEILFRARGCRDTTAEIQADGAPHRAWRFRCTDRPLKLVWSPTRPGPHQLTVRARGTRGSTSQTTISLRARR